jgi:aspartyl protease family protein
MFGLDDDLSVRLLYLVLLLAFILGGLRYWNLMRGTAVRHLAVWALIVIGLVAVYAYREPFIRFAAPVLQVLQPSRVVATNSDDGSTELMIGRGGDGHFHIDASANGVPLRFLVDTGASDTVVTLVDAERLGIDPASLRFNRPVETANGTSFFARATLDSLQIGPYRLSDVPVGIMPEGTLNTNLLGMSTINRFASWRMEGDRLVLIP